MCAFWPWLAESRQYRNIFKQIYRKGFKGVVGMEHGVKDNNTKEGEMACIQAYVSCDNFEIDGK